MAVEVSLCYSLVMRFLFLYFLATIFAWGLAVPSDILAEGTLLPEAARVGASAAWHLLEIKVPLVAGRSYRLTDLAVFNDGLAVDSFTLRSRFAVTPVEGLGGEASAWVSFDPSEFCLSASRSRVVAVGLRVPTGARAGDYAIDLKVRRSSVLGRITDRTLAVSRVVFTVQQPSVIDLVGEFGETHPEVLLVVAVILLLVAGFLLHRFFVVALVLERRR